MPTACRTARVTGACGGARRRRRGARARRAESLAVERSAAVRRHGAPPVEAEERSGALRLEQYAAKVRLVAAHPSPGSAPAAAAGHPRRRLAPRSQSQRADDHLRALADAARRRPRRSWRSTARRWWRRGARGVVRRGRALVLPPATISAADALLDRPEAAILAFAALAALGASYSSPRRSSSTRCRCLRRWSVDDEDGLLVGHDEAAVGEERQALAARSSAPAAAPAAAPARRARPRRCSRSRGDFDPADGAVLESATYRLPLPS